MDNYVEIKDRIIELMETLAEGLLHIRKQLSELRYEEALILFSDAKDAINAITNTIDIIKTELPENKIDILVLEVLAAIDVVMDSYTQGEELSLDYKIAENLLPSFEKWRVEVERALRYNWWS